MAQFITTIRTDLDSPLGQYTIGGKMFTQDNKANRINVELYKNKVKVNAEGEITGIVKRNDGKAVAFSGGIENGNAYVVLPETAYAIEGPIDILVRETISDTKTVIAVCKAYVTKTADADYVTAGSTVVSIEELVEALDQLDPLIERMQAVDVETLSDLTDKLEDLDEKLDTWTETEASINELTENLHAEAEEASETITAATETAVTAKNTAVAARDAAIIAKNDAVDAKDDAVTAKNDAIAAKNAAESAAARNVTDWLDEHVTSGETLVIDNTLSIEGAAAEAKAAGDELGQLKSAISVNLAGTSIGHLYPVHILSGSKITVSTSDGSTFDQTVKLHYWGQNKNRRGQWAFGSSYGDSRTVTANSDIYWLSFEWQEATEFGIETGETMQLPYMVNIGNFAEVYQAWFEQPQVYALRQDVNALNSSLSAVDGKINATNQYRNEAENPFVSLNANYFDPESAAWQDGFITTSSGNLNENASYEHAFCPLRGPGVYITQISGDAFGVNSKRLALFDIDKTYIKYIDCDSFDADKNTQKYTLSSADALIARYTVLQRKKTENVIPKLFFGPVYDTPSTFPVGDDLPLPPVYGTITDPLYKKTVVCDGDSICAASLDNPYQWQGWFGRILRGYQTSGKNYAVGGGTIMDRTDETVGGNPRHCIALDIDTIHSEYPNLDYLILEGGTNDADLTGAFSGDTPPERFGTWDKDSMSADYCAALDTTTFCGAVEYLFWKAITYYPNAKIGFIVAMKMGIYTNQKTNRKRYFDEIMEIAKKWGIPVLNLWDDLHAVANFDAYYDRTKTAAENVTAGKFYNDGQHPTSYGYNLMQPMIEAWVKTL